MGDALDNLRIKLAVPVKGYIRRSASGKEVVVGMYQRRGLKAMLEHGLAGGRKRPNSQENFATTLEAVRTRRNVPGGPAPSAPKITHGATPKPPSPPKVKEATPPKPKAPKVGKTKGTGTAKDPIITGNVDEAIKALVANKHVQLKQPRQVSTLLDKLAKMVDEAKKAGNESPKINLCNVSVPGTNLFCEKSKGIPRVQMPQLAGTPRPGSKAAKMPKNEYGEVDLSEAFAHHLATKGVRVTDGELDAKYMKASQNELEGGKVAHLSDLIQQHGYDRSRPVWISNDDYVIDGHHRWAAAVGAEYKENRALVIPTRTVDMDIISVLREALDWTNKMGLKTESMGAKLKFSRAGGCIGC